MVQRAVFDAGALKRAWKEVCHLKEAPLLPGFLGTAVRVPAGVLVRVRLRVHVGTRLRRVLLAGGR